MKQEIIHFSIVVRDYDEAIDFYANVLGFELLEDTYQAEQDKRWVVVAPKGSTGVSVILARASNDDQVKYIGNQTGGRVSFFLNTDDFWRDYQLYLDRGVNFVREPKETDYGKVAVFEDLYGNRWDLLEMNEDHHISKRFSE